MTDKVYIVITNFTGGWDHLRECLESLLRIEYPAYQIIVVDDYSRDDSIACFTEWAAEQDIMVMEFFDNGIASAADWDAPGIILIRSCKNRGFAGANNLALTHILHNYDFSYIWLLNNDTVVTPRALSELIFRLQEDQQAGMCGSTLLYYHDRKTIQALGGASFNKWTAVGRQICSNQAFSPEIDRRKVEQKLDYIHGASMLITGSFLKDIGLMNEEYFIYFEEIDWAIRAKGRYSLAWAPNSIVYHKAGITIGGGYHMNSVSSLFSDYYYFKNMLLFTRNFFPWAVPFVYLRQFVMLLQKIKGRQWPNARLLLKVMLGSRIKPETLPRYFPDKENDHV